jgi:hypothetical protein
VDCPAVNLCLGVDDGGGILRTSAPAGPATGWQRSVQPTATDGLNAISCPSTRFCAAVGNDDRVLTSAHPGSATPWTSVRLPYIFEGDDGPFPYDLESVTCPSAAFCLTIPAEDGLIVSTSPSAGANTWHLIRPAAGDANDWFAASCPTASFCVAGDAVGRIAVSTHPARGDSWRLTRKVATMGAAISAMSCPSARFCLAGDQGGSVHWSTRPGGGTRAWHAVKISGGRLIAVSCRSRRFCVVITSRHAAYASTDPTGGPRAWHDIDLPASPFPAAGPAQENQRSVACAPRRVCVATNGAGVVFPGRTAP